MNKKKEKYFRKIISRKLDEIIEELDQQDKVSYATLERLADPSDRATSESERTFRLTMLERDNGMIMELKYALMRLDEGIYGICEECEEDISEPRLEVQPSTTLCLECKREQEQIRHY